MFKELPPGNVHERNSCGRPLVRSICALLPLSRKVRALHHKQLFVFREVSQLVPRVALGRTNKQFRSHCLPEFERLFPVWLIVARVNPSQTLGRPQKTPRSRRTPIHAEYLARHCVIHIHLTDLIWLISQSGITRHPS